MTLDPLVRKVRLGPGRELLLVDTVGFVRKLPHSLVAAFRATLEEVAEADLLLHVVDASRRGRRRARGRGRGGAARRSARATGPSLLVLNKADRPIRERLRALGRGARWLGLRLGPHGPGPRRAAGARRRARLELRPRRVTLRFAAGDRRGIARVYAAGRVLRHEVEDGQVTLEAELPERALERYREPPA